MENDIVKEMQTFCDSCVYCETCNEYCSFAQEHRNNLDK